MRLVVAAFVLALGACSPPSAPTAPSSAVLAAAGGEARTAAPSFVVARESVVGQWSFDRTCGLYDLVFGADGNVDYFDYADHSHVLSYVGRWAMADHNRIAMTVRLRGPDAAPTGDERTYAFDVAGPIADDLNGRFGEAGGPSNAITAKRCPEEDRD